MSQKMHITYDILVESDVDCGWEPLCPFIFKTGGRYACLVFQASLAQNHAGDPMRHQLCIKAAKP